MSGEADRPFCSMGCREGGPDGNRQHVWDLLQGMRGEGPVRNPGVAMNYNISPPQRESGKPSGREFGHADRPKGERS